MATSPKVITEEQQDIMWLDRYCFLGKLPRNAECLSWLPVYFSFSTIVLISKDENTRHFDKEEKHIFYALQQKMAQSRGVKFIHLNMGML